MMIVLTLLNDKRLELDADLIERVDATPCTAILMVDGSRHAVKETLAEVVDQALRCRAGVLAAASVIQTCAAEEPADPVGQIRNSQRR